MVKVGASVLMPDFPDVPQPSAFKAALPPLMAANETIFHPELPHHKACQAAFFFFSITDNSLSMKELGH